MIFFKDIAKLNEYAKAYKIICLMLQLGYNTPRLQPLHASWLQQQEVQLDVLRLDEVHPIVSGNKLFKLHYYLKQAAEQHCTTIASFGGAYSNHIVATAYACHKRGFKSVGIIRGEASANSSHTLLQAQAWGMQLHHVSREAYRHKEDLKSLYPGACWINEGGYGATGAAGASLMLQYVPCLQQYSHIVCAVGTGTTLAGLVAGSLPGQVLVGISALKGHSALADDVKKLLDEEQQQRDFFIMDNFHFGGYARHSPALLAYMNKMWQAHNLPTDFVYTAKALYGTEAMIRQEHIPRGSRVLLVHTGGLQGNLSLAAGTLAF